MSRATIYNRNYPGKKIEKGTMLTHDAQKIVQKYIEHALTLNMFDNGKPHATDTYVDTRLHLINLFSMCMAHTIRVSNNVDITYMRELVNAYMSTHENGIYEALKLVCSFIDSILFEADAYHGYNNYKWSTYGSKQLFKDYPSFNEAELHSREDKYNSQEYHRIYY